jgi:3-methylcrotonyl-CoA carboxylase alpha subunit
MMKSQAPYRRFRTLLIANRGEIAARVIRTARAMGLRTVAVYSEADRDALHVAMADEAVLLGPARARDSYLNIERVIEAACQSGAEAVHPGYGFLSENAEFAQACADAGLVFVGPTADMMTAMGSKSGSKMLMEKAGVPLVPGYHGEAQDEATLKKAADKIGFPVVEEAPSPTLDAARRDAVCAAARKAAAAVNYVGAGTIEFVSDGKDVFFIEMNTRLQVEHPVTELITGIDLVEWQLRVAFGEKLPLAQDEIKLNGHAIEARVYAENPHKNFMPSVGKIRTWRMPEPSDGLRIDAGYREGDAVSPHYDAMLAKVSAGAPPREAAIDRLNRGLEESDIRGIVTNIPFLSALVTHPDVRANAIDTGFIERELRNLTPEPAAPGDLELCAAVVAILSEEAKAASTEAPSPWRIAGWMPVGQRQRIFTFRHGHEAGHEIRLQYGNGPATLSTGGREFAFTFSEGVDGGFDLALNGMKSHIVAVIEGHELYLRTRNGRFDLHWVDPFGGETEEQVGEDKIVAPLPGTVVALLAEIGATLEKGAPILTLEVMKMEQTLRAPFAGVLKAIKCKVGDIVGEGVELAEVEPLAS